MSAVNKKVQILCKAWFERKHLWDWVQTQVVTNITKVMCCSLHCTCLPDLGIVCFPVKVSIQLGHKTSQSYVNKPCFFPGLWNNTALLTTGSFIKHSRE